MTHTEISNNLISHSESGKPVSGSDNVFGQGWLLITLEKLLAIETQDVKTALSEASDLVAQALRADKVDVFLYDPADDTLVAMGVSDTPLGHKQIATGLNRLPLADGGRTVLVYQEQQPYLTGHSDEDPEQLIAVIDVLGVRSVLSVPLYVKGELRGVLEATARQLEAFNEYDLRFLQAVAGWVGTILHRAELNEQIRNAAVEEARRATAEELVSVIAHDLRNYITPLTGRVNFIHKRAMRDGRERDLEDTERMASTLQQMNRMIHDLLDVGRLEQGLFAVSKRPADLVKLVGEIVDTFDSTSYPIQVQVNPSSVPPEIRLEVDAGRLRQALENLLANALKVSPEGVPVKVSIDTEQREGTWWARVEVSDKGPGVNPEIMPRLFQRFGKDSNSSGLGMGLYLARGIVTAHGGTLTVESVSDPERETGTSFFMALPMTGVS